MRISYLNDTSEAPRESDRLAPATSVLFTSGQSPIISASLRTPPDLSNSPTELLSCSLGKISVSASAASGLLDQLNVSIPASDFVGVSHGSAWCAVVLAARQQTGQPASRPIRMLVLPITSEGACPTWAMIELQGEIALRHGLSEDNCRVGTLALSATVRLVHLFYKQQPFGSSHSHPLELSDACAASCYVLAQNL